jgi:hypothetical protein
MPKALIFDPFLSFSVFPPFLNLVAPFFLSKFRKSKAVGSGVNAKRLSRADMGYVEEQFLRTTNLSLLRLFIESYVICAEVCPDFDRTIAQYLQ